MKRILLLLLFCVTVGALIFFARATNVPTCTPASITIQPASQASCQGSTVSFTVTASGSTPLSYQWRKNSTNLNNGGNISGVTTMNLTITNITTTDAASYDVVVANNCGNVTSSGASLTVPAPPTITTQPTNQTASVGDTVTFTVTAGGTTPGYQWYFNTNTLLPWATSASLTLTNVQLTNAGAYRVVVSNLCGTVPSSNAFLTVNGSVSPPSITQQPTNLTVFKGSNATFSVVATGTSPLSYQWRKNSSILVDGGNVSGAHSNILTLTNVKPWDAGIYTVTVTNTAGSVVSSLAALRVWAPSGIVAWGYPLYGLTNVPVDLTNAVAIFAARYHNLVLKSDSTLLTWGNNSYGQTNVPSSLTNAVAIAGGFYHNLALKGDGTVVAWGAGTTNSGSIPNCGQSIVPSDLTNVVAIAGGGYHSLALKVDGTVVAWGAGTTNSGSSPNYGQSIVPSGLTNAVAVAGGFYHSLALKSDGTVVAWGAGTTNSGSSPNYGQSIVPSGLTNVVAIASGTYVSLALKCDGTVVVWGYGNYGQTNVPSGLTNIVAVAAGNYHCLALKCDGTVVVWGYNYLGVTNMPSGLTNVVAIASGWYHNLALGSLSPVIVTQPTNTTVTYGQQATFFVQATGTTPLQYQWRLNGTNIPGATANFYFVSQPRVADSGAVYSVIVSNAYGTATSSNATLTVAKAPLTIRADNKAKIYSQTNPPLTWSALGFVYGEGTNVLTGTPVLSTTASNTSPAGNYTITITNGTLTASNYVFTFANGILSVVKAPLVVTADNQTMTYGAANPSLTWHITGFVNGETTNVLSGVPQIGTVATNGSPVGVYPIAITTGTLSATNYSFGFVNGTLTVNKAALTVTANNTNRIYGAANPVFTATYNGFVNGDTPNVLSGLPLLTTAAVSNSPTWTYTITNAMGTLSASNYNFTIFNNGTLTIAKAPLTVLADNKTMYLGDTIPALTWTFSGFVAGDKTNVISGAPALSTVSSVSSTNTYTITNTLGTLSAVNYSFILSNGVLTVLSPSSTITFSNSVMNYLIGSPPTVMDSNLTVTARGSASFVNARLTASFSASQPGDYLSVLTADQINVTNATGGTDPYVINEGTTNIATLTPGSPTNNLVIRFNTNATVARVQKVARKLTYSNTSTSPSSNQRQINYCLTVSNANNNLMDSLVVSNWVNLRCPTNIYVAFIIDKTSSMLTADIGLTNTFGSNRLAAAKGAAIAFLGHLQASVDQVRVLSFVGNPWTTYNPTYDTAGFTNDFTYVSNRIAAITNNGTGTVYPPSLIVAYTNFVGYTNLMDITNRQTLPLIVFLTDGEQNGAATNWQWAIDIAHSNLWAGIRLVTIGVGGDIGANTTAQNLLTLMASSPQDFHMSTNGLGLQQVYSDLADSVCRYTNLPPIVYAGPDTTNVFTALPGVVTNTGSSYDQDNLPAGLLTNLWSVVPPDASVTFANATLTNTTATFTLPGVYTLQLLTSDTQLSATDTVTITIRELPGVAITNPAPNAVFLPGTNILIQARAASRDGGVSRVEFFHGDISVGFINNASPIGTNGYSMTWSNVPPGNYALTAVATDIHGLTNVSSAVYITVLGPPSIYIATPSTGDTFNAPAILRLASVVRDTDGVVTHVYYYTNGVKCGWSTAGSAFPLILNNVLGSTNQIQLTAVARDNNGVNATSPPVNVTVFRQPPVVHLTAPASNAVFSLGEPIVIQATASDVDGWIANLVILTNGVQLSAAATNSITVNWTNAPAGSNQISAIAVDNDGLSATSTVPISVQGCVAPGVSNLVLSVNTILGGGQLSGTVILSNAATTGGQAVNLYSSSANVIVPASVYVPEGQSSNSFTISTLPVSATNTFTISASYHSQTVKTASLTVDSWPDGNTNAVQYCGPMDVVFAIDTTGSMEDVLDSVKNSLTNTLNSIVMASLGDYRIGLVTLSGGIANCGSNNCGFSGDYVCVQQVLCPTNRDQITSEIQNLYAAGGGGEAECSDEALNTVINTLSATDPNRNQCGDFTTPFRPQARKIIILVTDAQPGSFQDYYDDTVRSNAFERAAQAAANGIEISAVNVNWYDNGIRDQMMHYYADTTGGVYTEAPDGSQAGQAIKAVLAQCGTSQGRVIFVRDDQNRQYAPFTVAGPQLGAAASTPAAFDTKGMWGNVMGARAQRAGTLQTTPGSRFDVEIGVSALTNVASSFGLLFTNAHKLTGTNHYSIEWELPNTFYPDAEACLGGMYSLQLSNRVSSVCGQAYTATDTPETAWPWDKNIFTLAVVMDRQIPQGRCRDFVLAGDDSPVNGTWDIVFRDQVIAASGQPNGWDVEDDYTAYGGLTLTVPTNAVPDKSYELRVQEAGWTGGRSIRFEVLPSGSIGSVPVLLPLVLSTNTIASSTTVALTVALDAPAPLGDAYVPLYTNGTACSVVVIPAGQTVATTTITASGSIGNTFEVLASYNGYRKAKVIVVSSSCLAPYPPPNPNADPNTINGAVLVTWDAVPAATSYSISRELNGVNPITLFSGLTTNRFVDTTVLPGTNYAYIVTAFTKLVLQHGNDSDYQHAVQQSRSGAVDYSLWRDFQRQRGCAVDELYAGNGDVLQYKWFAGHQFRLIRERRGHFSYQ